MSSNSYPSPISSSAPSPLLSTTPIDPPAPTGTYRTMPRSTARPVAPPEDIAAVAASVRARLAQVRSDLSEIWNGLPEPASQLRTHGQDVGPNHEAIMLTGEPTPDSVPATDETSPNMSTQELIDAYDYSFRRVVQAQSSLALMAEQASFLRQSIDHVPAPLIEPPAHGRIRAQPLPSQTPRYLGPSGSSIDDGVTAAGRRVAIREQQGAQRRALNRTDTLPADLEDDDYETLVPNRPPSLISTAEPGVVAAREAELRTLQTQQMQLRRETDLQAIRQLELHNAEAMRIRQEFTDLRLLSIEARRLGQVQNQLASPTSPGPPPSALPLEPRRRRLLPPRPSSTGSRSSRSGNSGTSSTLSSEQSRLSILSGSLNGIENFSSPPHGTPPILPPSARPLLFDEPENWVESPRGTMDNADIMVDEVMSGRNYLVRRRITPEGTERIQNITLPESTEPDSLELWVPRAEPQSDSDVVRRRSMLQAVHERSSIRGQSTTSLPASTAPRRRGWGESGSSLPTVGEVYRSRRAARVDADGDDIPVDDEEELERMGTESRIRRARYAPPGALLFDSEDMSRSWSQSSRGSTQDSVIDPVSSDIVSPSEAFRQGLQADNALPKLLRRRLDPLPMALEDMVAPSKRARHEREDVRVVVGSWASFAGR